MTTVDVTIRDDGGTRDLLSLHNGLFGPATQVQLAVFDALRQGEADDAGEYDVLVPGDVLRRILTTVPLDGPAYSGSATPDQLQRFLATELRDERSYLVTCIEF